MDLQARGRPDLRLAVRETDGWSTQGDYEGLQVLGYYPPVCTARWCGPVWRACSGRSCKRSASIAQRGGPCCGLIDEAQRTLQRYLALAVELTQPIAVVLWLAYGLWSSGKSTHSFTAGGSAWRGAPAG